MSGIMLAVAAGAVNLSGTVSPPSSDAGGFDNAPSLPGVTVLVAGGSGTYAYAWFETIAPPGVSLIIGSPTSQSTSLSLTGVGPGDEIEGIVTVTATDTVGGASVSVDVPFSYIRYD